MNFIEYQTQAIKTESLLPQDTKIDGYLLQKLSTRFAEAGKKLDVFKKRMFYGKQSEELVYMEVERTDVNLRVIHALIGVATEAGELMEALLIALRANSLTDAIKTNIKEEVSDVCWYLAILLDELGFDFYEILTMNIEKLRARYGDKFSAERAINRNLEIEQKIIEG